MICTTMNSEISILVSVTRIQTYEVVDVLAHVVDEYLTLVQDAIPQREGNRADDGGAEVVHFLNRLLKEDEDSNRENEYQVHQEHYLAQDFFGYPDQKGSELEEGFVGVSAMVEERCEHQKHVEGVNKNQIFALSDHGKQVEVRVLLEIQAR